MRLVSYDDGRAGCLAGDRVIPLHGRTMRDVIAAWSAAGLASLLDPGETIQLPYHDRRFDQEGELALVIGRTARRVSEQDAAMRSCAAGCPANCGRKPVPGT